MVKFKLFGFPITIQWWFWLICLLFGLMVSGGAPGQKGLILIISAFPIFFVSITGHELGHAWLRRVHGARYSEIVLHGLGGYCTGPGSFTKGQRVQILLAGPIFNLLLAGVCYVLFRFGVFANPMAHILCGWVMLINVFLGVFNLLPIWPMDGGQIFETLMRGSLKYDWVYKISFGLAVALGIFGLMGGQFLLIIVMAQIAMQNWTKMTGRSYRGF